MSGPLDIRFGLRVCFAAVAAALLFAGCASPGPRTQFVERIAPTSVTNLAAYREDNSLEIHYPLMGKARFAHATLASTTPVAGEYQCQFAMLSLAREPRAARKAVVHPENRIVIRDAAQWKQLLHEIFASFVPRNPGHGVLLLSGNMELVIFRDSSGTLNAVNLQDKPAEIAVDHTYTDPDFSRRAIRFLETGVSAIDPNESQFLFLTGEDPTFVLVDLRGRLIVFLGYQDHTETEPVQVPGSFAFRTLNTLLIKSFILTLVKNPASMIGRGLWQLGNSGMTMLKSVPTTANIVPPPLYTGPGMDLNAWEKELDRIVTARRYKGTAQFFINGNQFFPALIQSIEDAKQSVDVMVYIFGSDHYATRIADVLKERSSVLRERVLMDDVGSLFAGSPPASARPAGFQPPASIKSYLQTGSRVAVRVSTDPWLATDHRKCIIIDNRKAYVGGMNFGWVYRYAWHDLMVGLTGPIVGRLEKDYREAWAYSGPFGDFGYAWVSLFGRSGAAKNDITGGIDIRPLRTATGEMQIYHAQLAAIRRAKCYIYIENAYFNDATMLRELIQARQRGVDVRVVLPSENDVGIMQTTDMLMANAMARNGIRVYMYPGMTHVKAAIYDGWACVGSANLEKMSLRISQELDVAFSDPATAGHLKQQLFEADFKNSQELKNPAPLNWVDSLMKAFADQF